MRESTLLTKAYRKNYTKGLLRKRVYEPELEKREMFYQIEKERICIPAASPTGQAKE